MEKDIVMNTGTRVFTAGFMTEYVNILYDCKWAILAILLMVVADYRGEKSESAKRYKEAEEAGDRYLMDLYKWQRSRAVRRSVNNSIDYIMWICAGATIGMAILTPFGVNYIYAVVCATCLAILCEVSSMGGHFLYLHGINVPKGSVTRFLKAVLVAFVKRKNEDLGEAIEDGFSKTRIEDEKGNSHNDNRHVAHGRDSRRV